MYLVFNVFYFYSRVGQKDSGVGRAHLAPPFATPLLLPLDPTVFTPITFRHTKRLPIRISKPSHKKFYFKKKLDYHLSETEHKTNIGSIQIVAHLKRFCLTHHLLKSYEK
jgi:hypothetical protein